MIRKYKTYGRDGIEVITVISEDDENVYLLPGGKPESNKNYFNTFDQAKNHLIKNQRKHITTLKENLRAHIKAEKLNIKRVLSNLDTLSEYESPI